MADVVLHWIPLGAGQRVVRLSGRVFETLSAVVQRRPRQALFHSALTVGLGDVRSVIEMAPVVDPAQDRLGTRDRGVVGVGPVGTRWAGRLPIFRYEIRCWPGGHIPDLELAAATSPIRLDDVAARRLLELVGSVPTPVWGRDELRAGEMWNSNSVISWLLVTMDVPVGSLTPPGGGRAPGWHAGVVVGQRREPVDGRRPGVRSEQ
jgi:hypothetical protein